MVGIWAHIAAMKGEVCRNMKFFYSASVMGYGNGRWWHKYYNFPKLQCVTKTITLKPKIGRPYAIIKLNKSVYNSVALHNEGIYSWIHNHYTPYKDVIVSIYGKNYDELDEMFSILENLHISGIEINLSCPNVSNTIIKHIPTTHHKIYLKLNYKMDPYQFDLDSVDGIRLNSIPMYICGGSGLVAKNKNWEYIKRYRELNIAGCSFYNFEDIRKLEDIGCTEIGIGSTILTNVKLIEGLL